MHGLVNRAIEDMATKAGGKGCWQAICKKANVNETSFLSMKDYPDEVTYSLVGAASEMLEQPSEEILRAFGKHWILFTAQEGYGDLMALSGSDLKSFLQNLNRMHGQVAASMPDLTPPQFSVEEIGEQRFRIHYQSTRQGLAPMVIGMLEGLVQRFDLTADIEHVESREAETNHEVFEIAIC
ncbi:MAG: heme NO-binding domain-containing protein [Planctomycetota bacterium]